MAAQYPEIVRQGDLGRFGVDVLRWRGRVIRERLRLIGWDGGNDLSPASGIVQP